MSKNRISYSEYCNRRGMKAVAEAEAKVWEEYLGQYSDVAIAARNNALDRAAHAGDYWFIKRDDFIKVSA